MASDARSLDDVPDDSVELVVTSPPYPMIEMWDELFAELDADIGDAVEAGNGELAYELMHDQLDRVWAEVERVLVDGGIACVNVGDATRKIGGTFELFPNHATVVDRFRSRGFQSLPTILWRKPTNKKTKFMGSGMVPPNAYVTLENEKILVFRNGSRRRLEPGADERYEAAYFWEERNDWFTDLWEDVGSVRQGGASGSRDRSAAFPVEVPRRLISMFSVYGDTVLDPFVGTGTTTVAAMEAARNSVGVDVDAEILDAIHPRVEAVPESSREWAASRLADHREFASEGSCNYDASHYDTRVKTKQERDIRFYVADEIDSTNTGYDVTHVPYEG